jgi:hypothetical protein
LGILHKKANKMVPLETSHSGPMQTSKAGCSFPDDFDFPRAVGGFGYEFVLAVLF